MADNKGAYGGSRASDTDFRRTWDKAEYEQRAKDAALKEKEESKARYEAKLAGKKYIRRASTPPDARDTTARTTRLNVASLVGKTSIVAAGASQGKRGRGAGFYCEACDLTFKDNIQLVEHYNTRQHLVAIGETGKVKVATVEDVRARLRWLKRKLDEEKREEVVDLNTRLEERGVQEEQEREERRQKRNERRRKKTKTEEDSD